MTARPPNPRHRSLVTFRVRITCLTTRVWTAPRRSTATSAASRDRTTYWLAACNHQGVGQWADVVVKLDKMIVVCIIVVFPLMSNHADSNPCTSCEVLEHQAPEALNVATTSEWLLLCEFWSMVL
jgi:hypothetical protein